MNYWSMNPGKIDIGEETIPLYLEGLHVVNFEYDDHDYKEESQSLKYI